MRKHLAALLITTLATSCVATDHYGSTSGASTVAIGSDAPPDDDAAPVDETAPVEQVAPDAPLVDDEGYPIWDEGTIDITTLELMSQADVDADPDAYSWLTDGGASLVAAHDILSAPCDGLEACVAPTPAIAVAARAIGDIELAMPIESTELTTAAMCTTEMLAPPKTVTARTLLKRFLSNSWSKLVKSVNEQAGKALNKLLNGKSLPKEASEKLAAIAKKHPDDANAALKEFIAWAKSQKKSKYALALISAAVGAGAVYLFDEIKDAIKTHILGIETKEQEIEKLKKDLQKVKDKLGLKCDGDSPMDDPDRAALLAEYEKKLEELEKADGELEKLLEEFEESLDELEKSLKDAGLEDVEPDPAK